jgi:hypothetical protein
MDKYHLPCLSRGLLNLVKVGEKRLWFLLTRSGQTKSLETYQSKNSFYNYGNTTSTNKFQVAENQQTL